ncbi:MAG: CU044_2847 family protein [Pseudonocardiaceae bacterium]
MAERVLVTAGGAEFYVEVSDAGGPTTIRDEGPLSFDGVRATVQGIATELAEVWQKVKPSEASVAFGLKLTAKSGKLTGLVVEGGGEASLTVTLTWQQPGAPNAS